MHKIDVHLHLTLEQHDNPQMFVSSASNMLSHLDELNIKKGILMSSGEDSLLMSNSECLEIVKKHPDRYLWMANLDYKDEHTIYERLEKYKNQGAVGIGELMINKRIDDSFIQEIFRCAEILELPILFHMSPKEGFEYGIVDEAGLCLLEDSLIKYPNLKIIGHSQPFWHEMSKDPGKTLEERNSWGEGPIKEGGRTPYLFEKYDNLYGDLSANSGSRAIMRDKEFGIKFLNDNQDRLMFGTDMVNVEMTFPLGLYLQELYEENLITKEVYEKICYKNAEKLFKLGGKDEN